MRGCFKIVHYQKSARRVRTDIFGTNRRLSAKNAKIARPTLFNYLFTREEFEGYANELFKMMIEDKFNVKIHEVYPVQDVARAHNVSFIFLVISAPRSMLTCGKRTLRVEKQPGNYCSSLSFFKCSLQLKKRDISLPF